MTVMVTGGAGYIGAHVVRLLLGRGEDVVVVDDLSTGTGERVSGSTLVELDLAAPEAIETLERVIVERRITGVVHFAAQKQVGESVARPTFYYEQNVGGLLNLLTAMERGGVDRVVFSSSAAVYGEPDVELIRETTPQNPINPYGRTKLVGEWMMADAERAWGLRWFGLRYFNVAGAGWPELGDPAVLNLIPMVMARLAAGRPPTIFGDDYPTPDGTCVRDYVHVLDLAEAHLVALDALAADAPATPGAPVDLARRVVNIGTGSGSSVREVVEEVLRVTGSGLAPELAARRPGDPARLVAAVDRAQDLLGFRARRALPEIVASAWGAWPHQHRAP